MSQADRQSDLDSLRIRRSVRTHIGDERVLVQNYYRRRASHCSMAPQELAVWQNEVATTPVDRLTEEERLLREMNGN